MSTDTFCYCDPLMRFIAKVMIIPTKSVVFTFAHTKAYGAKFDLAKQYAKVNQGSSCQQIIMDPYPQCCILSHMAIGTSVPEKKKNKG